MSKDESQGPKVVTTWEELENEATKLAEFHASAVEASEDILYATAAKSELLLKKALAKHKGLKALPTFRVSSAVYDSEGTVPSGVRLVN